MEASWVILEPLGGLFGHLKGVLEPSWGRPEASWPLSRLPGGVGGTGWIVPDRALGVLGGSLIDQIQLKGIQAMRHTGLDPGQLKAVD